MEESWTLFSAILGVGFPLHKPEMFGEKMGTCTRAMLARV